MSAARIAATLGNARHAWLCRCHCPQRPEHEPHNIIIVNTSRGNRHPLPRRGLRPAWPSRGVARPRLRPSGRVVSFKARLRVNAWRKREPGRFTPPAWRLLRALADYANDRTLQCWPSTAALTDDLGMARRTIFKLLRELQDGGALAIKHRALMGRHGGRTSSLYTIALPEEPLASQPPTGEASKVPLEHFGQAASKVPGRSKVPQGRSKVPQGHREHSLNLTRTTTTTEADTARGRGGGDDYDRHEGLNGWQPSAAMVAELRRERPDLTDARIQERTADWRAYAAENGTPKNLAAAWRGFLLKTPKSEKSRGFQI